MSRVSWILALLLVGSLAANYVIGTRGLEYYRRMNAERLRFSTARRPAPDTEIDVLLIGDSRVERWRPAPFQDLRVLNVGISGETTSMILERAGFDLDPLRPRVIVIQAGINDLKCIALFPEQARAIRDRTLAQLLELARRGKATGAQVVMLSVIPRGPLNPVRALVWSEAVDRAVEHVNKELASRATSDGFHWVDCDSVLVEQGQVVDDYLIDLLHLNETGYGRLNAMVNERVASLLE